MWANYNTATADPASPADNHYQMLLAKSTDGGQSFSKPVVVSNFYELPDCLTYQNSDPGRACVPEKGPSTNSVFRAANYPSGAVNPKKPSQVVVTLGVVHQRGLEGARLHSGGLESGHAAGAVQRRQDGNVQQRHPGERLERRRRDVHGDGGGPADRADGQPRSGPGEDRPVLAVGGVRQARQARRRLLRPPVRQADRLAGGAVRRVARLLGHHDRGEQGRLLQVGYEAGHVVVDAGADAVPGRERPGAVLRRLHRDGRRTTRRSRSGPTPATRSSSCARAAARRSSAPGPTRTRPATSSQTTRRSTPRRCLSRTGS